MKNLLLHLSLLGTLLVSADSLAQTKKRYYSRVDFFRDEKYLVPGYRNFSVQKTTFNTIPKLSYDKKGVGMCEIICLPDDLKAWQERVQKATDSLISLKKLGQVDITGSMILKIAADPKIQKRHSIYAFYTREQDVGLESDLQNKVRRPQFPSYVYVFKRDGLNWLLLEKVLAKDWRAYSDLEFNTIISK